MTEAAAGNVSLHFSTGLHLVWGRVVADVPDFCRVLVAALAEG